MCKKNLLLTDYSCEMSFKNIIFTLNKKPGYETVTNQ